MIPILKHWQIAPPIPEEIASNLLDFHPVLRQLLYNRGIRTQEDARLYTEGPAQPEATPTLMLGIEQSVERIWHAIRRQEPIVVYGDYDVDGVTATALLVQTLEALGANVSGYIPNRFDEGYGLNIEAIRQLHDAGKSLLITVDCGIRSFEEVEYARSLGMHIIITDHHHPLEQLPDAQAIINPRQRDDPYPDKDLAGVGLAYKLASMLFAQNDGITRIHDLNELTDLVALGTVSDLAPLTGENRSLVRQGLRQLRRTRRPGLLALMGVAGLTPARVTTSDIGFGLGPRLNAAGRLDSALAALNLLMTKDGMESGKLAQVLDDQNRERQALTHRIQEQARQQAFARDPDAYLIFAADPEYSMGVVGLAASKLTEQFYRPAIVAQISDETTRGSGRSIPEFHLTAALDQCADLLERHGGHAAAAGFTVKNNNLPELIERLQSIARSQLEPIELRPTLNADLEIPLSELHPDLLRLLDILQPTGLGNPQATFVSRDLKVAKHRAIGKESQHLKLTVTDGRITYDAIAFRQAQWDEHMPERVDLLYHFETNEFNGRTTLQLNVRDIRPAASGEA